jgi:single-strand DNA-binding protein
MVNRIFLLGNVGKDPETIKTTNSQVSKFSLATSESYKDKSGQKQTETEWHDCEAWGKLSEIIEKYIIKGTQVYVEGKSKTQTWDNKDGVKQYRKIVVVNSLTMLGKKENVNKEKPQSKVDEMISRTDRSETEDLF